MLIKSISFLVHIYFLSCFNVSALSLDHLVGKPLKISTISRGQKRYLDYVGIYSGAEVNFDKTSTNTQFIIRKISYNLYEISPSTNTNYNIDVWGASSSNRAYIKLYSRYTKTYGNRNQRWSVASLGPNGSFRLYPQHAPHMRLDCDSYNDAIIWQSNGWSNQDFHFEVASSTLDHLVGFPVKISTIGHDGRRRYLDYVGLYSGAEVNFDKTSTHTRFYVRKISYNVYEISPAANTNYNIDVWGASSSNRAYIKLYSRYTQKYGNRNQRWSVASSGPNGSFRLYPQHASHMRLDCDSAKDAIIWQSNGWKNQNIYFHR